MKIKHHIFNTFPEFSRLTLADRDKYDSLVMGYPPFSDISFATLMSWWNPLNSCYVSQLNNNLVISYWFPGNDKISGLSLVGTNDVDESVAVVMDWLKAKGEPVRLMHIPEFVVQNMQFPELFTFTEERDFAEYIIPVSRFFPLDKAVRHKRWKIRRFQVEIEPSRMSLKSLDLLSSIDKQMLIDAAYMWSQRGTLNDFGSYEQDSLETAITQAEEIGFDNICLFIDGILHSFLMHKVSPDGRYATTAYFRFSFGLPYICEFSFYKFAEWFADKGVKYINIDADLGIPAMRTNMLALGPVNFFRKYSITPAQQVNLVNFLE